jgi:uncharacterized protein YggT (Ycf19 family)
MRNNSVLLILVNIIMGIIEALIGLRIILKLFGANPNTPFVQWIYGWSEPLLRPFQNIFPSPVIGEQFVLEMSSLFALIVYGILSYLLIRLVLMIEAGRRP